jgi:hypothetical protein
VQLSNISGSPTKVEIFASTAPTALFAQSPYLEILVSVLVDEGIHMTAVMMTSLTMTPSRWSINSKISSIVYNGMLVHLVGLEIMLWVRFIPHLLDTDCSFDRESGS